MPLLSLSLSLSPSLSLSLSLSLCVFYLESIIRRYFFPTDSYCVISSALAASCIPNTKDNPMTTTSTTDKTSQTHEERLAERGAIMPDQADKTSLCGYRGKFGHYVLECRIRRKVSWPSEAENLPTTPQIPAATIVVECS